MRLHSSSTVTGRDADTISLTLPAEPRYATVARIVVGGVGARLNLSYETLDDLQLAVETLLAEKRILSDDHVSLELEVGEGSLAITIGPIDPVATRSALVEDGDLPLGIVLGAMVDEAVVDDATATLFLLRTFPALQHE